MIRHDIAIDVGNPFCTIQPFFTCSAFSCFRTFLSFVIIMLVSVLLIVSSCLLPLNFFLLLAQNMYNIYACIIGVSLSEPHT